MQTIIGLLTIVSVILVIESNTYNQEYDNFNAEELVDNIHLLKSYGKCFLEKGPCTPDGLEFKRIIPEALRTSCAKCTAKQRQLVRTVARGFLKKLPDCWEELVKMEDPKGEYKADFEQFLNSYD